MHLWGVRAIQVTNLVTLTEPKLLEMNWNAQIVIGHHRNRTVSVGLQIDSGS